MYTIDELLKKFGETVKLKRKLKRITQQELALATNITKRQIQRIEAGEDDPHFGTFFTLCVYLDISIESIFYPDIPESDSDFLRIHAKMSSCTPEERQIILKTMDYMTTLFQNK